MLRGLVYTLILLLKINSGNTLDVIYINLKDCLIITSITHDQAQGLVYINY